MATMITQEETNVWWGDLLTRLNRQASAWLNEISNTQGVKNAFLCDNHGNVLGALVNDNYDRATLRRTGQCIAQIFGALETAGNAGPKEVEFAFERMKLTVRDLGGALGVIITPLNMNGSMVRMAMNVASAPFESDVDLQRSLKTVGTARRESLTQSSLAEGSWELARKAKLVG